MHWLDPFLKNLKLSSLFAPSIFAHQRYVRQLAPQFWVCTSSLCIIYVLSSYVDVEVFVNTIKLMRNFFVWFTSFSQERWCSSADRIFNSRSTWKCVGMVKLQRASSILPWHYAVLPLSLSSNALYVPSLIASTYFRISWKVNVFISESCIGNNIYQHRFIPWLGKKYPRWFVWCLKTP